VDGIASGSRRYLKLSVLDTYVRWLIGIDKVAMNETEWTFDVGFTTSRPVVPDEHTSRVTVLAESFADAMDTAALMVMRPGVEMPTSTRYVE
jgi:hypothetical protein